jgi:hypothetical protein
LIERTIETYITEYLSARQAPEWEWRAVEAFGFLPLHSDWTILWGLTPAGSVAFLLHHLTRI